MPETLTDFAAQVEPHLARPTARECGSTELPVRFADFSQPAMFDWQDIGR